MRALRVRDLVGTYIGGGWGKDRADSRHTAHAHVIRGTDFSRVIQSDRQGVPGRFHEPGNAARRRLEPGDIVFEVSGGSKDQPVGRTLLITERMLTGFGGPVIPASFCKRIRVDRRIAEPAYVYYFCKMIYANRKITQWQTQSTGISNFSFEKFLDECEINIPSLPVQRRIAGLLWVYDELIENDLRRIRILEEMARALYREWFVDFRFPGHETAPKIASSIGPVPQGWELVAFTELADVLSGGTPKTDVPEYWNGTIPFFTPRDAPDCFYVQDTAKHITELGLSKCSSQLYAPDTVFITARGTVGKVALPSVPMAMNQSCYGLRGKNGIAQRFLFSMTLEQVDYLRTNTGGATFDTIVVDTLRRMQVVKPPSEFVANFVRLTDSMFDAMNILQSRTANLRRARDMLLPRLLSGQLSVGAEAA